MKIDADIITAETIRQIADKAYDASMNVMRMYYEVLASEITPADAAAKLRDILAPLQIESDEKARYFRSRVNGAIRRYGIGIPSFRLADCQLWDSGNNIQIDELDELWDEITAEEGEP